MPRRISARARALVGPAVLLSLLAAPPALAADGNLPGGTSISVDLTAPPDGALYAAPPGDVPIAGTAAVGQSTPISDTTLIYVIDRSGSTASYAGCGGDQNGDGISDTTLDCEIAAVRDLNDDAAAAGTVDQVGLVSFNGAATTDRGLGDPSGIDGALGGLSSGGGTNFEAAVQEACNLASSPANSNSNTIVVFLSDGFSSGNAVDFLPCSRPATFQTFAVGAGAQCDAGGSSNSLSAIAAKTGGACTQVTDPTQLSSVVPAVIDSQLTSVTLSVDGGPQQPLDTSPPTPQQGPASVDFSTSRTLAPGNHELCVTANGSDGGGSGSVTECRDVTVATIDLSPATATNELRPGASHTVTATVAAGPDGGVAGVPVTIEIVSGPNAGASTTAPTAPDGTVSFTYPATQGPAGLGTDQIRACFTDSTSVQACDDAEKKWVDTTAPSVTCEQTTNPSGGNVPPAKNPDGFYVLRATDAVDPHPQLFVRDSGSSAVFGPFDSGTRIKLTQAPGATPSKKPGAGVIDWHITLKGDALVTATDASGNTSAPVSCKVPPPPK